ncbi:MAG TPA: serine/threonine protein phosphatase, partial [Candidatus Poseidoniales archaeon]|nr:serine/threonine protein phosphatase [Candidatus Poseidoniales archaeon]
MDEMVLQMRNIELENLLNKALAEGNHVWVIGDVHGYANVLTSLIEKLALGPNDHVVLLGDMIDRGPNSCGVIDIVRDNSNIHSIKGNHEDMMIRAYEEINKRCA